MALVRGFRDQFDWALFVTVCAIAVMGVVNLYSATSAAGSGLQDIYITQIYWLTLGAGVAVLTASIDYRYYERHGYTAYVGELFCCCWYSRLETRYVDQPVGLPLAHSPCSRAS